MKHGGYETKYDCGSKYTAVCKNIFRYNKKRTQIEHSACFTPAGEAWRLSKANSLRSLYLVFGGAVLNLTGTFVNVKS